MTGTISAAMREIIDRVYPVGIILDFAQETDPNSAIGCGTSWTRLTDGRTLIASDSSHAVGWTGGAETVALTKAEIPSHAHSFSVTSNAAGSHQHTFGSVSGHQFFNADSTGGLWSGDNQFMLAAKNKIAGTSGVENVLTTSNLITGNPIQSAGSHTHSMSGSTTTTGSGAAHTNMQPSLAVCRWKRTA